MYPLYTSAGACGVLCLSVSISTYFLFWDLFEIVLLGKSDMGQSFVG
jgi:hypothetical protein